MGRFVYGSPSIAVEFDDRLLAHLKVVITSKLRRGESFLFTWNFASSSGSGNSSVWLHPAIPLQFELMGNREPSINRAWIEELAASSNSSSGLRIAPEPNLSDPAPLKVPRVDVPPGKQRRAH